MTSQSVRRVSVLLAGAVVMWPSLSGGASLSGGEAASSTDSTSLWSIADSTTDTRETAEASPVRSLSGRASDEPVWKWKVSSKVGDPVPLASWRVGSDVDEELGYVILSLNWRF